MSDQSVPEGLDAEGAALRDLLIEEIQIEGHGPDDEPHVEYCWWCREDINGRSQKTPQPHAPDCWLVRARKVLAGGEAVVPSTSALSRLIETAKDAAREWRLHGQLTDSCRHLERAIADVEAAAPDVRHAPQGVLVRLQNEITLIRRYPTGGPSEPLDSLMEDAVNAFHADASSWSALRDRIGHFLDTPHQPSHERKAARTLLSEVFRWASAVRAPSVQTRDASK